MMDLIKANASTAGTDRDVQKTALRVNSISLCSGVGQYHSDEPTASKRVPYIGKTIPEIFAMAKNPPSVEKSKAEWSIPSALFSRNFAKQESEGVFWGSWVDFDIRPRPLGSVVKHWNDATGGCIGLFNTTSSATEKAQKSRGFFPYAEPLSGSDWILVQQCLNDMFEFGFFTPDRANERPAQLFYLPNAGRYYDYKITNNGQCFDPLKFFEEEIEKKRAVLAAEELEAIERCKAAEANRLSFHASGSTSAIDAFNACYTIDEVLLQAAYERRGNSYRHPQSESGSYSATIKDGRVNALSPKDPLFTGKGAHDAFSAWAVLFFGGDQSAAAKVVYDQIRRSA